MMNAPAPRRGFSFWVSAADTCRATRHGPLHYRCMDDLTEDEQLAEAIGDVTFVVCNRIGNDPDTRRAFFKPFRAASAGRYLTLAVAVRLERERPLAGDPATLAATGGNA
jgi:hypothetical protein